MLYVMCRCKRKWGMSMDVYTQTSSMSNKANMTVKWNAAETQNEQVTESKTGQRTKDSTNRYSFAHMIQKHCTNTEQNSQGIKKGVCVWWVIRGCVCEFLGPAMWRMANITSLLFGFLCAVALGYVWKISELCLRIFVCACFEIHFCIFVLSKQNTTLIHSQNTDSKLIFFKICFLYILHICKFVSEHKFPTSVAQIHPLLMQHGQLTNRSAYRFTVLISGYPLYCHDRQSDASALHPWTLTSKLQVTAKCYTDD